MWQKSALYLILMSHFLLLNIHINAYAEETKSVKLLVWGDSLSAAYGIPVEQGWVHLLQQQLGKQVTVINASVSGETTEGGLTRLPAALEQYQPQVMLLELGANDGLRGINTEVTQSNLNKMIQMAQQYDTKVVVLGIKIPPNYGVAYTTRFEQVFADLAQQYSLGFVPFILEGIATDYDLMQADGLHPNAKAQPILLQNIMPTLEKVLKIRHPS